MGSSRSLPDTRQQEVAWVLTVTGSVATRLGESSHAPGPAVVVGTSPSMHGFSAGIE